MAWNSAASRGLRRLARDCGVTKTAMPARRRSATSSVLDRLLGAVVVRLVLCAAVLVELLLQLFRQFLHLRVPLLEDVGDLARLLLVRDVERRLLSVRAL